MRWEKTLTVVGAHAEGEIGRVVTGGVLDIPGATIREKLAYLNREGDEFRRFCVYEPRGCAQMSTNLLLPATVPGADAAFIPMQSDACHAMSGSNAMCVVTVLLEMGILPMREPETTVVLDTAAGQVTGIARCREGRVEAVSLDFMPSFADQLEHPIEVEGLGTIFVDIAFGGIYYALADARDLGLEISPGSARDMVDLGNRIRSAAREQVTVQHPEIPEFNEIEFVMFCDRPGETGRIFRNGTVMPPGRMDRSPCGTGTAARLAVLLEKGLVRVGEELEMRSIINSSFRASILSRTTIGARHAILPRITGRAWIFGIFQLGADPSDPFRSGFTLGDTWGTGMEHRMPSTE